MGDYRRRDLDPEQAIEERYTIQGLRFVEQPPKSSRQRNSTHRYSFENREVATKRGKELVEITTTQKIGMVAKIDVSRRRIDIKKHGAAADVHPSGVFVNDRVPPGAMPEALLSFAQGTVSD